MPHHWDEVPFIPRITEIEKLTLTNAGEDGKQLRLLQVGWRVYKVILSFGRTTPQDVKWSSISTPRCLLKKNENFSPQRYSQKYS